VVVKSPNSKNITYAFDSASFGIENSARTIVIDPISDQRG
jgi:hypothetical protein